MPDLDLACPVNWSHPLNRGRVLWWLALGQSGCRGNTFRDLIGMSARSGYDATLVNAPTWAGSRGRPGGYGSLQLASASSTRATSTKTTFPSGNVAITAAVWVRPTDVTGLKIFFKTGKDGVGGNVGYFLYRNTTSYVGEFGSGTGAATATSAAAANVWAHVCGVYDKANNYLFVNGVLKATTAYSAANFTAETTNKGTTVGGDWADAGLTFKFDGAADDVTMLNVALSAAEVAALYDQSRRGHPDTLNWLDRS